MSQRIAKPSIYQQAIFDFVLDGEGNAIVQACAGGGKTATIIHAMNLLSASEQADCVYLVFNVRNREEAAKRLAGSKVKPATLNGYGMRALPKGARWQGLDAKDKPWKCWRIMKQDLRLDRDEDRCYGGFCVKMVGLARSAGIGICMENTPEAWTAIADHHEVSPDSALGDIERGIELAMELLRRMIEMARTQRYIDFDDQIYLPLLPGFGGNVPRPAWIFVDEAQDLSPIQAEFIARMMGAKPGGSIPADCTQRVVFVGDRYQAIYGFRGADSGSMDNLKARFNCRELPLSVCYRCGSDFVALAASLGAPIEAAPGKPTGTLRSWTAEDGSYRVSAGTVVLCRATAPLVANAYKLIRQGRKANVLGKDIGKGLISLIEKHKPTSLIDLTSKLHTWVDRECERMGEGKEPQQEALRDKVDCIEVLMGALPAGMQTVAGLISTVEGLFTNDEMSPGVVFSTIHKAKGLEWDSVVILDAHKMPATWARKDWQREQEIHCAYVAYTRAIDELTLVRAEHFEQADRASNDGGANTLSVLVG